MIAAASPGSYVAVSVGIGAGDGGGVAVTGGGRGINVGVGEGIVVGRGSSASEVTGRHPPNKPRSRQRRMKTAILQRLVVIVEVFRLPSK